MSQQLESSKSDDITQTDAQISSICPVCGTANHCQSLAFYSAEQAAAHFCTETRDADRNVRLRRCIARLWGGEIAHFRRCDRCGFGYGYPFIGGDEEFYSILHEQHDYPRWRWEYELALAEISEVSNQRSPAVIDIGAGNGAYLRNLPAGWRRFAVEASSTMRTLLSKDGIVVCRSLTEAVNGHAGRFHLVTMFQVLEHLANFADALANCREIINDAGRLVISVPDCDAMIEQERATGITDMPPSHINKWTPHSLELALTRAGFRVDRIVWERASLATLTDSIHQKVMANAANPRSLGAQIYRIRTRKIRALLLSVLAIPATLMLLKHWRFLLKGGSFAVIARPVN
jgi:SAM-dependent methyltransferase